MTWESIALDLDLDGAAIISASDAQLVVVVSTCDIGTGFDLTEVNRLARRGRPSDRATYRR